MATFALPPEDRTHSPITGWTRSHWEAVADHLLGAVVPTATDGFAQYRLPGPPSRSGPASDGLEGFARTFLLAAFRVAGAGGSAPGSLLERYAAGLAAGTDPAHRYAWPALTDMAQPLVEAASIALGLHETRAWLFDRLAPEVRDRIVDWLSGFVGRRTPNSNWVLFQVVVEQFLASVGGPHDPAEIEGGLDRIESWYVGGGWYSDGPGRNFDYYCGWALHLYPVLWARMSGDTRRARRYAQRLTDFLTGYQHFFAADGSPVFQGRSLTYRFATVAPFWLGALTDATPLAPGLTRRLASGVLRHFVQHEAPDRQGLLTLGWYGPFSPMIQAYSGPASPYWASKAFLGLLLPSEHPVWADPEAHAPVETGDTTVALPEPGWLLHGTRADGVVRLLNHGSDRAKQPADPLYVRLAYSSHTGPLLSGDQAVDGQITVITPDGATSVRRRVRPFAARDRFAASAYEDELPGGPVRVITASVVGDGAEVRVHAVTAPAGHGLRDGGFALADVQPLNIDADTTWARASRPDGLTSFVAALAGFTGAAVQTASGADAFGPYSAVPYLTGTEHAGLYVSLVALGGTAPAVPLVEVDQTKVVLHWVSGGTTEIRLGQKRLEYERRAADDAVLGQWRGKVPW